MTLQAARNCLPYEQDIRSNIQYRLRHTLAARLTTRNHHACRIVIPQTLDADCIHTAAILPPQHSRVARTASQHQWIYNSLVSVCSVSGTHTVTEGPLSLDRHNTRVPQSSQVQQQSSQSELRLNLLAASPAGYVLGLLVSRAVPGSNMVAPAS